MKKFKNMRRELKLLNTVLKNMAAKVEWEFREEEHKEALYDHIGKIDEILFDLKRDYENFKEVESSDPPESFYFNYSFNGVSESDFL